MDLAIQVLRLITSQVRPDRSVLVGIDGGAGSGKTTFTRWLAETIGRAISPVHIVHTDNFCRPSAERVNPRLPLAVVSDIDWQRLCSQVLVPLRSGKAAHFQLYDWPADCLKDWVTIDIGGVTMVDGVTATRNELASYYDLRIWFSCPRDIRISRLLKRGDTSLAEIEHWLPSEDDYIASHMPEKRAHLVLDSSTNQAADQSQWLVRRWSPPATT
jgi:uridine kinase